MKTRRRIIKTPIKGGRRSSIICVKKCPVVRRSSRRLLNTKSKNNNVTITQYESPLKHLCHNSLNDAPSTSRNSKFNKEVKCNNVSLGNKEKINVNSNIIDLSSSLEPSRNSKLNKEIKCNNVSEDNNEKISVNSSIIDLSSSLERSIVLKEASKNILEKNNESSDDSTSFEISNASKKCIKRKKRKSKQLNNSRKIKKQKLNKSPLSRPNLMRELDNLSDSIFADVKTEAVFIKSEKEATSIKLEKLDTLVKSEEVATSIKSEEIIPSIELEAFPSSSFKNNSVNESITETWSSESLKPCLIVNPEIRNEDVVVIESNESLAEMEAYHNAFNQSTNSAPESLEAKDSIIVIDADDEPCVETKSVTPTLNEDCCVVWSSLPQPCTSTSSSNITGNNVHMNSWYNASLLKADKIYLDTRAELNNLRYLNNENSKPSSRKMTKSPKVSKATKKSSVKTFLNAIKSSNRVVGKPKTASKITTKTKNTPALKNKVNKDCGELIFLSESTEDVTKGKGKKGKLREIVVDGNNIGMAYSNNKMFSEKGIKLIIDYFTKKGHTVKVFIPQYRRSRNYPLLEKWNTEGIVVFTPSRKLGNKSYTPYDDRYIVEYATACGGIVVSQDQFRDLYAENPEYRDTIENRLLVPTFVGDYVMFPVDPLGRDGPTLTNFLKH